MFDEFAIERPGYADDLRMSLSRQFSTPVQRALFARTISSEPVGIARLITAPVRSQLISPEKAYAIHIYMAPHGRVDACIDGKYIQVPAGKAGDISLADLEVPQMGNFREAMDVLHVRFPKRVLNDLAYDRGIRHGKTLRTILAGVHDPILYGLARILAEKINDYGPEDQLFVDHVTLAFHAHIVRAYGDGMVAFATKGILASWQVSRSCELMLANLNGNITLAALAASCGLSVSYFSRAFRQTMGVPPHKWLMAQRVKKAKYLLKHSQLSTIDIALLCGFGDQSHFNRVFYKFERTPPVRWRKMNRG